MPDHAPLISIITPSYNQGAFIQATIESVLGQGYPNLQYIVADGGSTDATLDILRRYEGQLEWFSEPDRGPEDAINKGFRRSKGEILAWLASDDTYLPGTLARIAALFAEHPDVGLLYGRCCYIDETGSIIGECPTEPFDGAYLAVYNFIAQPSAFFRRSAYDAAGELSLDLRMATDYDLWIRMTRKARACWIPEFLSNYRLHASGKTVGYHDPSVKFEEYVRLTMQYYGWAPANRVYPCCLFRLRMRPWLGRLGRLLAVVALPYAAYEYLRLNRGVCWADIRLLPRNLKKLLFGWELEDLMKEHLG